MFSSRALILILIRIDTRDKLFVPYLEEPRIRYISNQSTHNSCLRIIHIPASLLDMDIRKVQPTVFYWTRQPALGYSFNHCLGTITCEVPTSELGSLCHILANCWVPVCSCYAGYVDNETEDLRMTANGTLRSQLPLLVGTQGLSEREPSDHRYTTWLFKQVTSYLLRFVRSSGGIPLVWVSFLIVGPRTDLSE